MNGGSKSKNWEHDRLQALAESPALISGPEELKALTAHVKECTSCAHRLSQAVEFDTKVINPLRKQWRHLSSRQLRQFKQQGFDPQASPGENWNEWHLSVCPRCRARFKGLSGEAVHISIKGLAVASSLALLVIAVAISVVWLGREASESERAPLRSPVKVELLAPEDQAVLGLSDLKFHWKPVGGVREYVITVTEASSGRIAMQKAIRETAVSPSSDDLSVLTTGREYTWSISAEADGIELDSPVRSFLLTSPQGGLGNYQLPIQRREELRARVRAAGPEELDRIIEELADISERFQGRIDAAWLLKTWGDALLFLDRYSNAITKYEESIALWEDLGIPDSLQYANTLINYASVSQDSGLLDQSIHSYEKALAISRSLTTDAALRSRSTCLLNYGTLLRQLGLPMQARRAYEEALEIDRRRQDPGVVEDLTNLGNILADELGQPLIGLSLLEEALDRHRQLVEKGEERDTIAATLDSLAWTYRKLGKPHQALTLYQEALEVDQRDQYQRGIIETSNNLAELYSEELGDEDTAFAIYSQNLDLIQSFPDANPDDVWKTHDGLGRIHLRRGNSRQADQHFQQAVNIIAQLRDTLSESQHRRLFRSERTLPYYGKALYAISQSDRAELFEVFEAARANTLTEVLANASQNGALTLAKAREELPDGAMLVEYFLGLPSDPLIIMALSARTTQFLTTGRSSEIRRLAQRVIDDFQSEGSEPNDDRLNQLSSALMPETLLNLQKGESIRRLLISPDGILHRIPFDALVGSDEAYLGETLRLSVIPSLTWWSRVRQNRQNLGQIKDALVVADPVVENPGDQKLRRSAAELVWADFTFEPIRESQREAASVLKYASLGSESLLGRQATVERFNLASPSMFRVLHFATHAVSGATLDTSFLLFGRRNETLDVLTGPMIQDLELDGQLVVLSGCDTAAGRPLSVEGMDSLADAFLMAGADCVIASRWPVSDDAPVPLMKEFYRQLYLGRPVEEALWTAKRQLSGQLGVSVKNWPAFAAFGFCDFPLPIKPSLSAAMTEYSRMHWPSLFLLVLMSCGLLICVYRLWKFQN